MLDPHIVKSFDEKLLELHRLILRMGHQTEQLFDESLKALIHQDTDLAKRIAENTQISLLENQANEQVVLLLALRAPVADDLRVVVASLKIASALRSIGDYAKGIARRSMLLVEETGVPSERTLLRMGELVHHLLQEVLDCLEQGDADKAQELRLRDREVDDLYASLFREFLTYMMENTRNIAPCSHLLFVTKNIERIGDQTTNIAEMIYFLVHGQNLTDERPKGEFAAG